MCYAGGPYCDKNVQPRLDKAKKAFVQDKNPENLQALKELQFEYDSTPKGQKLLKEKIEDPTTDADTIISLGERLEKAEARRAYEMEKYSLRQKEKKTKIEAQSTSIVNQINNQIRNIDNEIAELEDESHTAWTDRQKEIQIEMDRKKEELRNLKKTKNIVKEGIVSVESQKFSMKSRLESADVYGYDNVKELESGYFTDVRYSVNCDVEEEIPANCNCDPDGPHRCWTISSVNIENEGLKSIIASSYPRYKRLAPEQKNEIKKIYEKNGAFDKENYTVNIYQGFYGDEYEVAFDNGENLRKDLNLYALSSPNNSDSNEIFAMAREAGVDTRHKTPLNVVKEDLIKRNGGKAPRYLKSVEKVSYKSIPSDYITIPQQRSDQRDNNESIFRHGILYANEDGTYTAVGNIGQVKKNKNDPQVLGANYMILSK